MAGKAFASSDDLADKTQNFEILADGVYALTADGDPIVGAVDADDFLIGFGALATPQPREGGWNSFASTRRNRSGIWCCRTTTPYASSVRPRSTRKSSSRTRTLAS